MKYTVTVQLANVFMYPPVCSLSQAQDTAESLARCFGTCMVWNSSVDVLRVLEENGSVYLGQVAFDTANGRGAVSVMAEK